MTKLLIVEDDTELREVLTELLRQSGHQVAAYAEGTVAFTALLTGRFDLAIIDWMLPGMSGIEMVRGVRQRSLVLPILMVTARDAVTDRVVGLDSGADDYLVKPFQMAELEARVRALLRRAGVDTATPLRVGPLTFVPGEPRIQLGDTPVDLPPGEFALLQLLTARAGSVVSKQVIAGSLGRGGERPTDTAIEVCVHRLRRRLAPFQLKIRALRGFGYVLEHLE